MAGAVRTPEMLLLQHLAALLAGRILCMVAGVFFCWQAEKEMRGLRRRDTHTNSRVEYLHSSRL